MRYWRGQQEMAFMERPVVMVGSSNDLEAITDVHGPLITPWLAATLANVSHQRIYALIELGRFTKILVCGVVQIPMREFHAWECSSRTPGRPRSNSGQMDFVDGKRFLSELPAGSKGREGRALSEDDQSTLSAS